MSRHNPDRHVGGIWAYSSGLNYWIPQSPSLLGPAHRIWIVECLIDEVLKIVWKYRKMYFGTFRRVENEAKNIPIILGKEQK